MAADGERNIQRLSDQLLVNGRQRGDVERERAEEEAEEGGRDLSELGEIQERDW